ncbi:MAG: hypothetical protein L0Y39_03205, partial [Methylococcaceae bacterium]|nr:hypothetical protein [Methylococcaceae bacterium]
MQFAASTTHLENLVLGYLMAQGWNIEHLARLDDDCSGQRTMADIALTRRYVLLNRIRMRNHLQRMARMP